MKGKGDSVCMWGRLFLKVKEGIFDKMILKQNLEENEVPYRCPGTAKSKSKILEWESAWQVQGA